MRKKKKKSYECVCESPCMSQRIAAATMITHTHTHECALYSWLYNIISCTCDKNTCVCVRAFKTAWRQRRWRDYYVLRQSIPCASRDDKKERNFIIEGKNIRTHTRTRAFLAMVLRHFLARQSTPPPPAHPWHLRARENFSLSRIVAPYPVPEPHEDTPPVIY